MVDLILGRLRRRRQDRPSVSPERDERSQLNHDQVDRDDGGFGDDGPYAHDGLSHGTK